MASLRKEVGALPEMKRYSEALPSYRSMLKSKSLTHAAGDIDFIYGVAKIFDPDSVVREGEMVIVRRTQSLPKGVKGWLLRIVQGGERLTPEAKERILDVANIAWAN